MEQQTVRQPGERIMDRLVLERGLSLLALGDVPDAYDEPVACLVHLADGDFDRENLFVATPPRGLEWSDADSDPRNHPREFGRFVARAGPQHGNQLAQMAADHFRGGKAEDLLARGIARLDQATVVDCQNAFGDVVEDRSELSFAFAQGRFGDCALTDLIRQLGVEDLQRGDRLAALPRKDLQREVQHPEWHDKHARTHRTELSVAAADKRAGESEEDVD